MRIAGKRAPANVLSMHRPEGGRREGSLTAGREGGRVCTCVATCYVHVSLQINRREGKYAQMWTCVETTLPCTREGAGIAKLFFKSDDFQANHVCTNAPSEKSLFTFPLCV